MSIPLKTEANRRNPRDPTPTNRGIQTHGANRRFPSVALRESGEEVAISVSLVRLMMALSVT
jgi:hypothetical protein